MAHSWRAHGYTALNILHFCFDDGLENNFTHYTLKTTLNNVNDHLKCKIFFLIYKIRHSLLHFEALRDYVPCLKSFS